MSPLKSQSSWAGSSSCFRVIHYWMCWDGISTDLSQTLCLKPASSSEQPLFSQGSHTLYSHHFSSLWALLGLASKAVQKDGAQSHQDLTEESQQLIHSFLTSSSGEEGKSFDQLSLYALSQEVMIQICRGALVYKENLLFHTHKAGSELTLEGLSSIECSWKNFLVLIHSVVHQNVLWFAKTNWSL